MAYQEKTETGYGGSLLGSLKGVGVGFVVFVIGTILLFWNEGNFIKTKKSIQEAEGITVSVSDVSAINAELNGKLIHASAFADTQDIITDGLFGVSEKAISIKREVVYYQNEEHTSTKTKNKLGGGKEKVTTYTYEKKWVKKPINSNQFKDPGYKASNFVLTTIGERTEYAKNVTFGAYKLPRFIISSISGDLPADAKSSAQELKALESKIAGKVHVQGNVVYFGKDASNPSIGDVRVTLTKILPADISIIAKVADNTFEQYISSNGKTFSKVAMGTVSAETMFASAYSSNSMITWILRLVGVIVVIIGLKFMFGVLPAIFKVIPMLGDIVGAGVWLVSIVVGIAWSLLTISIGWLFYRPIIAIPMIVVAIAGIWYLKQKGKQTQPANG